MSFSQGFEGDVALIPYILRTLEAKTYAIPGITANDRVTVAVSGDSGYYFTQPASSVGTKTALGTLHPWAAADVKGVNRKSFNLDQGYPIFEVIPYVNSATVSADVLGERLTINSIERANACNREYLDTLVSGGTAKTYASAITADNVMSTILDAVATFNTDNKAKYLKPTAIFVSETVLAALRAKNLIIFKDALAGGNENILGYFNGMAVVEAQDLAAGSFVLMNQLGAGQVQNIKTLVVTDATAAGSPNGTLIAGELGVASVIVDESLVYVYTKAA